MTNQARPESAAGPTTTGDPKTLDRLLSDILKHYEGDPFFNPWSQRLAIDVREHWYRRLAKQLGPRYARCSFDSFVVYEERTAEPRPSQREVFRQIQEFAAEMPRRLRQGGGVVLYGRPGTGKDHLLYALAYWAILRHGFEVVWKNGSDLYQDARDRIRNTTDGESESRFVKAYTNPQILILSDPIPPKGEASDYSVELVQRILDRRYRNLKSTWATLNVHDGEEAERRLASPIIDRLRHGSLCCECNWPSYRARQEEDQ